MAFCSRCGTNVSDGVAFCPQCGAAIGAAAAPPPPPFQQYQPYAAPPVAGAGLQENVAAMLAYLAFFITGIIFLLIDKRPFVRFHAAQSLVFFGALFVLRIVMGFAFVGTWYFGFGFIHLIVFMILGLVWWISWLVFLILAYQGKSFEIPIVAGIARNITGKV